MITSVVRWLLPWSPPYHANIPVRVKRKRDRIPSMSGIAMLVAYPLGTAVVIGGVTGWLSHSWALGIATGIIAGGAVVAFGVHSLMQI